MSRPERFSLAAAFRCAGRGVWLMAHGRNGRLQISMAIIAVAAGLTFRIGRDEWLAVLLSITLVLALETINTGLEKVVDLVSPGYSDLARDAKDLAAGAVLIASVASVIVGIIVFTPYVHHLL